MDLFLALIPSAVEAIRQATQEETTALAVSDDGIKFLAASIAMGFGRAWPGPGHR